MYPYHKKDLPVIEGRKTTIQIPYQDFEVANRHLDPSKTKTIAIKANMTAH